MKQNKTPNRRYKDFIVNANIIESKLPLYDSFQDPHLSNYFFSRKLKKPNKNLQENPIYSIYNSSKSFSPIPEQKSPIKLPSIGRLQQKKFHPITSEQFRKMLLKYRKKDNNSKETENSSRRNLATN